jgi:hypothetical protein
MLIRTAAAAAAASLALALPVVGAAQTQMTGTQQTTILSSALAHFDRETQTLASMTNQISSHDIVVVPVAGLQLTPTARRALVRGMSGDRHTALQAALGKATVASEDRNNGQSEDQSSLAEYVQHLGIDPNNVVAVDIDGSHDAQNPRVTVFYRGHAHTG